ncbi:MAG: hypothetical protein RLZZ262_1814 [Bacteroidota bacterium]|jgi:type IX secretion system PorP/SprF family membrane protein
MIRNYIIIALLMSTFGGSDLLAQQEWIYTQFGMNLFDCNAAYAGQHETTSLGLRHRQQWTGFEGRPIANLLSVHLPLAKNKIGVGARLMHENIGARQSTSLSGAFAYRLRLKQSTLNFSLIIGFSRMGVNWSKLNVMDQDDAQVGLWQDPRWSTNIGAAIFYTRKNLYAGMEALQLNQADFQNSSFEQQIQLKGILGYHLKVRADDQLQMAALGRWSSIGMWQVEATALYLKNNRIGLGMGYRSQFGAMVLGQIHFSSYFRLGLSYDFSTQATQQLDERSFEIFLGYTMRGEKTKSVRYL